MKAVMYHYVREHDSSLPYFTYLHRDDFIEQLRLLEEQFGFCSRQAFLEWVREPLACPKPDGVVLTFDDGLIDHARVVAPILEDFGAWGIFYIPTGVHQSASLLDVHRIHLLLGRLGGQRCVELLREQSIVDMFPDSRREDFQTETYVRQQSSDGATKYFKRMTNYFIDYEWRSELLDRLFSVAVEASVIRGWEAGFYMSPQQIAELHRAGNVIGSHSVTHRVMSKLSIEEQREEIVDSLEQLSEYVDAEVETFCYPYGGSHSFTADTERLLQMSGVVYSFNVEQRDISPSDLTERPQVLPRYDCNQLPHGQASFGPLRPGRPIGG